MSDNLFAATVTFSFFAGLALWVPFLETCQKLFSKRSAPVVVEEPAVLDVGGLAID